MNKLKEVYETEQDLYNILKYEDIIKQYPTVREREYYIYTKDILLMKLKSTYEEDEQELQIESTLKDLIEGNEDIHERVQMLMNNYYTESLNYLKSILNRIPTDSSERMNRREKEIIQELRTILKGKEQYKEKAPASEPN